MKVSEKVTEKISPLFKGEIKLVDVDYLKKNDGMHLVVYIDKESGVDINDCVAVSELISDPLDELNPTDDKPFILDVSSYGLDKPLKYDWQFKRYLGKEVNVKLYKKLNGKKDFVAKLINFTSDEYAFELEDENVSLKASEIAQILPHIEF